MKFGANTRPSESDAPEASVSHVRDGWIVGRSLPIHEIMSGALPGFATCSVSKRCVPTVTAPKSNTAGAAAKPGATIENGAALESIAPPPRWRTRTRALALGVAGTVQP